MKNKMSLKKLVMSILPGMSLAFAGCFMLFFYAPFELYLTNHKEFWFTSGQMMPVVLLMFLGGFVLLVLLLAAARLISDRLYTAVLALGFVAVLALYVQGNFLVNNLPGLDGTVVDWAAYPAERIKSLAVWLVAAALAALLIKLLGAKNFANIAGFAGAGLALMLGITVGTLFLTVDEAEKANIPVATDRDMFTMSGDKNLVVFILDAIDACEFEKIVYGSDEYMEVFKDFTYYDNTMSGYPYTDCAEVFYLTGAWHEAKMDAGEYVKQAVAASPLFAALDEADYQTGLYSTTGFLMEGVPAERFANLTDAQPGLRSGAFMAKLMLKMSAVKYAPWDLKFFGYDLLGRQNENKVYGGDDGCEYFDWTNVAFYGRIKDENPITVTDVPVAKVIHLDGAHVPIRYDENLNIVENATYQSGIRGSIFLFANYAQRLKEAGVYDNTALVVMADHGYARSEDENLSTLQQHPILLVKGFGESRDEMLVNNAPISHEDLPNALVELISGKGSDSIFPWKEGDVRERRFLMYEWTDPDYFEEYVQTGQAEDMDTLLPTGRVFEYAG